MTRPVVSFLAMLAVLPLAYGTAVGADEEIKGLSRGKPEILSAGPLAFGERGLLFAADPIAAALWAIDTADRPAKRAEGKIDVEGIDAKVAALLGTTAAEIAIQDLAVNPASGSAYLSVARGRGADAKPAIVKVAAGGKLSLLDVSNVAFAKSELPNPPALDAVDRRNSRLRLESITDIAYMEGKVLVAGLSNEEFASTLRTVPFPFGEVAKGTSVEIYHGAHGALETRSPIRTFAPFWIGGEPHLLAAYTCTPLVSFPLKKLTPGVHLKGVTIAELGNRNRPLDMIVYEKNGKKFLLLANNSRGVMQISTDALDKAEPISARVEGTKGQPYETVAGWTGIEQLDQFDSSRAAIIRRDESGSFHLETRDLP
jgi:hypothetical protein